jgi:hypothetical protein
MREAVLDAILEAADAGNDRLAASSLAKHVTSSRRRIADAERIVTRFLECLPDEAMVRDIREALDGAEGYDDV